MARWFRSHSAKLESPKIQKLTDAQYRAWDSLLCVACRYDGVLPPLADTAFLLRKPEKATQAMIDLLIERKLFVRTERGVEPHQWNEHQYKSDVSTDRVKAFRERQRNVSVTPSESETDTERYSEANASGAGAPKFDPVKALFDDGVRLLTGAGTNEKQARSLVGKWRRDHGDEATREAIQAAYDCGITQPCEWIPKRLGIAGRPHETWDQRRIREAMEVIRDDRH